MTEGAKLSRFCHAAWSTLSGAQWRRAVCLAFAENGCFPPPEYRGL